MNVNRKVVRIPVSPLHCACAILLVLSHPIGNAGPALPPAAASAATANPGKATPNAVDAQQLTSRLYAGDLPPPSWLAGGHAEARQALRLLRNAPLNGLDPASYDTEGLARRLERLENAAATAAFERDLSTAMLQFLVDLRVGRTASDYRLPAGSPAGFDPVAQLRQAMNRNNLEEAVEAAEPTIPLYRRVKSTLAQYRELAGRYPHWPALPPVPRAGMTIGAEYQGAALLRERLRLLGDLGTASADDAAAGPVYTPGLAAAVRRFQSRHGLAEDGVPGPATIAALSVPLTHRVAQLELTLERLRWLPPPPKGRFVAVNLPTYRLWAFDGRNAGNMPPLEMRVIVGAAVRTPTPLFIGQMRYLEFNPYWNVPRSIAVGEILPKLARNPAYLRQNDMELVSNTGQVLSDTQAALASLQAGTARVRQRPGEINALGALKFAMPNPMNIYLHSTSARELFDRTRRDLSHGCIRVERPAELAQFVLDGQDRWDANRIGAAMRPGPTRTVSLREPIPVVLFYATAIADRQGRALFAEDVYRRDQKLILALHAR